MDAFTTIAGSGLTITLSPAQLLVAASVVGVVFASNAKSVLFAWHVSDLSCRQFSSNRTRDDSLHSLHGISYLDALSLQ